MEDLWAFNDEGVARAIFRSRIPVISAVGHEPDVTIADFVADLRASTPSNAAELAVPDQADLRDRLAHVQARMDRSMDRRLQARRDTLRRLGSSPFLQSPQRAIQEKRLLLDYQQQRLLHAMDRQIGEHRQQMGRLAASLDALSPFKVLSRGYSITQKDDGTVVFELSQVEKGDTLRVRVSDGTITCTAEGKEKTKWRKRS
jgi:exodeoxyribonuclease VII large subunit